MRKHSHMQASFGCSLSICATLRHFEFELRRAQSYWFAVHQRRGRFKKKKRERLARGIRDTSARHCRLGLGRHIRLCALPDIIGQRLQPCFCNFQRSIFNKPDYKSTEKRLWIFKNYCFNAISINWACDTSSLLAPFEDEIVVHSNSGTVLCSRQHYVNFSNAGWSVHRFSQRLHSTRS